MSHVDGINLLYVAVTRAKKELYMYVPSGLNVKSSSANIYSDISGIIRSAVENMGEMQKEPPVRNADNKIEYQRYTFGNKIERHIPKEESGTKSCFLLNEYPTHSPKVNVYKQLERFTNEGAKPGTASCNTGIRMHKIFEGANTLKDLYAAIEQMANDGLIKQSEAEKLYADIKNATDNDIVTEWFSGNWDDVKCEEEILYRGKTLRPDRVMISGDRAVVVDYKFVAEPNGDYHKQVKEYMAILKDMGCYGRIEGYVWYVHLNKIERSEED